VTAAESHILWPQNDVWFFAFPHPVRARNDEKTGLASEAE